MFEKEAVFTTARWHLNQDIISNPQNIEASLHFKVLLPVAKLADV